MRKLATAAAVSLALASGGAFGLGLGDIEMRSALNQPMNAEIPLTSVKSDELDGMIVKLADEAAFNRAGIDRTEVLKELTFTVDSSSGRPVIRIASRRPVVEPFLNFLLEVDWPQGRMVREYTVLLDPPVFMTQGPTARDLGAETRAVVDAESALVAPAPINRDTQRAAVDGLDVELVGAENEIADSAGSLADGDVISLDELDADSAALPADSLADGEIVSLTDLAVPNNVAPRGSVTDVELSDDLFEVEIVGEGIEVEDEATAAAPEVAGADEEVADDGAGEVVSLDDLDALDAPVDEPAAVAQSTTEQSEASRGPEEVRVERGDTLFEIARETADTGVTTQQMMLALLEANRTSFINDNINLVKAGSLLRVPRAAEAQALSQAQALAEIGRQTTLWQEYRDNLRNSTANTQIAASETPDDAGDTDAAGTESTEAEDALTEEARAILEEARNEVLNRDELSIVADSDSTASNGSATVDNADASAEGDTAARLSTINRQLQLAREELSASRLQGSDLGEQVAELTSTSENLDALVLLRQNEVARLEAQLADARNSADAAAGDVAVEVDAATSETTDAAADAAADAAPGTGEAIESAVDSADGAAEVVVDAATETADEIVADADNALSSTGEELEQVGLPGDSDADGESASDEATDEATDVAAGEATGEAATAPVTQEAWYQTLMNDPTRLMIAGAGAVGLLGVFGALLMRRRRKDDETDELAGFQADDVEFIDANEAAGLQAEVNAQSDPADAGTSGAGAAVVAATTAGTAATSDAANKLFGDDEPDAGHADPLLASDVRTELDAAIEEADDKDDTISEVDVYLAYGLHGQAEELLTQAIERKPDNIEYAEKLLQTYHAQGNAEGYRRAAEDYQERFGGDANPAWADIAEKGRELRPGDALFAAGAASVAAMGSGQLNSPAMSDDDFASSGADDVSSSVSRDFSSADEAIDEGALMDQSIDPAFAFDESDLEATGDFSQIADELAAERNESIDFPGFGDETPAEPVDQGPASDLPAEAAALEDALTLDELDLNAASAASDSDELMLDLDELDATSLDEAGLLDEAREGLDMPGIDAAADSSDEMDTMMDLAKAYIDMGDKDSASNALDEIVKGGSPAQISEAETLLRNIS